MQNRPAASTRELNYLSVSELAALLNQVLEKSFPEIFFEGEISEVTRASSGHLYFTVKDSTSKLSAVMWAGVSQTLDFPVQAGLSVQCHGRPNVYRGNGRLQIVVHRMFPSGEGALRKKFLELKAKLEKEGFFAEHRKRKLPFLPRAVGVVTSKTGAVIHDIMVRFRERMPSLQVYLVDVKVQGEGAAQEIAAGIAQLDKSKLVDVIIVARGGGSLEDLWAFNEEVVVKAIFASETPVVSGVGHEVDISLSDLVADLRAPTPTAASEMVVPHRKELMQRIADLERRLADSDRWLHPLMQNVDELSLRLENRIASIVEEGRLRLQAAEAKLRSIEPGEVIRGLHGRLDLLSQKLQAAALRELAKRAALLDGAAGDLRRAFPLQRITLAGERLQAAERKIQVALVSAQRARVSELDRLSSKLEAVSPQKVLQRGFSIVEGAVGVVRSVRDVAEQESLKITFAEGGARVTVTQKLNQR
ncbi:MAG: exodeoxyribonuclease VII large subunit [Deltaproteobacteria bacterium]|nr:exodeoxyribonuclease VII large subunit [Deltaproteobacteria bacterium]